MCERVCVVCFAALAVYTHYAARAAAAHKAKSYRGRVACVYLHALGIESARKSHDSLDDEGAGDQPTNRTTDRVFFSICVYVCVCVAVSHTCELILNYFRTVFHQYASTQHRMLSFLSKKK